MDIRRAIRNGLNDGVRSAAPKVRAAIESRIDRPRKITATQLRYRPASYADMTASLEWTAPWAEDVYEHLLQPKGTGRPPKASEVAIRRAGHMSNGQYVVPGPGLRLDKHGNIPGRVMNQILAAVRVQKLMVVPNAYTGERVRRKAHRHAASIAAVPGEGIVQHQPNGRPDKWLLIFTDGAPRYRRIMPYRDVSYRIIGREVDRALAAQLTRAWERS